MSRSCHLLRHSLMIGASATALVLAASPAAAQSNMFRRGGVDPAAQAARAAQNQSAAVQRAYDATARARESFTRARQAREQMVAAQAAARAAARAVEAQVPNGLTAGGLVVYPGAISDLDVQAQGHVWEGSKDPIQSVAGGGTMVTIEQTQQKSILTWQSFNVGRDTTVHFDQTGGNQADGTNNWVALNRVIDPSGDPSQILGNIKAEGSVYLINRNGIIFGGASQVNVRNLVVSALPIFSQDGFNDTLLFSNTKFRNSGLSAFADGGADFGGTPNADAPFGNITVEAGAEIGTDQGGFSFLLGNEVTNAGTIRADGGKIYLTAGSGAAFNDGNVLAIGQSSAFDEELGVTVDTTPVGTVLNTGLIESRRGGITLTGADIQQNGVVIATTSISRQGSLTFNAFDQFIQDFGDSRIGLLRFGSQSVTAILPDQDGETTTSSASADAVFKPGTATFRGGAITLEGGSLIAAPGANLTFAAVDNVRKAPGLDPVWGRVFVGRGATIDVAGLSDVQLSMETNLITVPRVGQNELADSPLQRDGFLYRQAITFDRRDHGVRWDGKAWVGTPVANVGGYADLVERDINEMLVDAGSITLSGGEVIAGEGSTLNLQGGYVHYLGGMVQTSKLLGADGRIYSASSVDPNVPIVGFAGDFNVTHGRWGVTESYSNPLF